jgi:hypothetical protein
MPCPKLPQRLAALRRYCREGAIATAAHGAAADAELIRLHRALLAHGEIVARIETEADSLPYGITPENRAQERRLTEADDAWSGILEDIIDTPARTAVGLRAKARPR